MADSQSNPPLVKHHTVIRDHQGNFSCDCSKFRTTGKTCSDIVAARYYAAYGPPADYLKSEQGPENHGPAAKGQKKVPPRNSTGKKGRKTNLPTDGTVDDIHDLFLEQLEQEKDWNPFSAQERPPPINDSRETIPPRTKASAGRPAAAKPLHSGRSGASSPVKFSSKPGPKGHGYNSILPPLPPPPAKSPTKIPPGLDMKTDPSVEKPMQELHKLFLVAPPISHQMQEELDIIDIDFKRWRVPTYRKREDEVLEVVEMSNALCLSINNGTLVYGPSYASDADVLRNIVWSSSDEEPILADGSPAFMEGSVLKKAWLHSQKMTLRRLLVFHHDPSRDHWLIFQLSLDEEISIESFEPLSEHLRLPDIQKMRLLGQFFSRFRPAQLPAPKKFRGYDVWELDIQRDGDSCGFWMVTVALMLICEIEISGTETGTRNIEILDNLGIAGIKDHWIALLTSWRIEEDGLGVLPVNNFLKHWGMQFADINATCIAPRPEWISRFDPVQAEESQQAIKGPAQEPAQSVSNKAKSKSTTSIDKAFAGAMKISFKDGVIQIQQCVQQMQSSQESLRFRNESLSGSDLNRFLDGIANDECLNLCIAALNFPMLPSQHSAFYIGSQLGLPKPARDFIVLTTFFYPQLAKCGKAWDRIHETKPKTTADFQKLVKRLLKWFKYVDLNQLMRIFIPIHQPGEKHWLLASIYYEHRRVVFVESWGPTQKLYQSSGSNALAKLPLHKEVYENCILLASILLSTGDSKRKDISPMIDNSQWAHTMARVPPQENGIDCGFYVLICLFQLLSFNAINPELCPQVLRAESSTMNYTRVLLALNLIRWCSDHHIPSTGSSNALSQHVLTPSVENQANETTAPTIIQGAPNAELNLAPKALITQTSLGPAFELDGKPISPMLSPPPVIDVDGLPSPVTKAKVKEEDIEYMIPDEIEILSENEMFALPSPLANLSPPHSPLHNLNTQSILSEQDDYSGNQQTHADIIHRKTKTRTFPFSCRCGDHGPDGTMFTNGLDVVQCKKCEVWSHISCQRFGRATKLPARTHFFCDACIREFPPVPRPPKGTGRTRNTSSRLKEGMGALVKHGKFHYPVRVLKRMPGKIWKVRFWHGCQFPVNDLDSPTNLPKLEMDVQESDLVDSLYGNQTARRAVRLGKYTHAHEIPVEEDILDNFQQQPFTPEIDDILGPHTDTLFSIFTEPLVENAGIPRIPAVNYAIASKNKDPTIPYAGDLTLQDQARVMNWFYHKIPQAKDHLTLWVGCPSYAHAITLVIAARNDIEFRSDSDFPAEDSAERQLETLWAWAWSVQTTEARIPVVDVDRECLGLLEEWMFESSDEAGVAGDEQWGLDAGHHQDRWVPYKDLPPAWSFYRSGVDNEEKYNRGQNFSDDSLDESEQLPPPEKTKSVRPKPKALNRAKKV